MGLEFQYGDPDNLRGKLAMYAKWNSREEGVIFPTIITIIDPRKLLPGNLEEFDESPEVVLRNWDLCVRTLNDPTFENPGEFKMPYFARYFAHGNPDKLIGGDFDVIDMGELSSIRSVGLIHRNYAGIYTFNFIDQQVKKLGIYVFLNDQDKVLETEINIEQSSQSIRDLLPQLFNSIEIGDQEKREGLEELMRGWASEGSKLYRETVQDVLGLASTQDPKRGEIIENRLRLYEALSQERYEDAVEIQKWMKRQEL